MKKVGCMIFINLSYFDTVLGPETLLTVPHTPEEDIEECTNSLLNISEFIELKFFVYVSSAHFKTSNIYTKLPSDWARGKLEMLLISIILVDEDFSRLHLFEALLERIVDDLNKIEDPYKAFYARHTERKDINEINAKKQAIEQLLLKYVPEIENIIAKAQQIPFDSEVIATQENLQDEFVRLQRNETALEAARKLAASPRVLMGCIIENDRPVGIVDEDDILNKVLLQGKDADKVKVEEIMTQNVITVDANEPIEKIIDLLIEKGILGVPILQNNIFQGVFTISDAANHNQNIIDLIGANLQDMSEHQLESIKQLKVKLWSYIRNISRNRKIFKKTQ